VFKKLRFRLELFGRLTQKYGLIAVLGILAGVAIHLSRPLLAAWWQSQTGQNQTRIGLKGNYTFADLPLSVTKQISFGLTQLVDNQKPILSPLSIYYDLQNNNTEYTFYLNSDLIWHDQQPVKVRDINPELKGITITELSPQQLKITTKEPYSPLLALLSQPLFKNKTLGLGDYQVDDVSYRGSWIKQLRLKNTQDDNYIVYKFFTSEKDLLTSFKLGETDIISTGENPQELLRDQPQLKMVKKINTTEKYLAIFINTTSSGLNNKSIRQALAYATSKSTDPNERCLGPIPPQSWAYNPNIKQYLFDPARAKELFKTDDDNLPLQDITLLVSGPDLITYADEIKTNWQQALGLNVTVQLSQGQAKTDFQAILTYWPIISDPDLYQYWHSTQSTNITRLNNTKIDRLLEEGRTTFDSSQRRSIYLDFQKTLLEESPAIFLKFPIEYQLSRS